MTVKLTVFTVSSTVFVFSSSVVTFLFRAFCKLFAWFYADKAAFAILGEPLFHKKIDGTA